ncbi:MAG TPA: HipA domain-containing protein [Actinomycetes bacterium]|nr:HipA domain-containing protein [Actinomycetes bacterium]
MSEQLDQLRWVEAADVYKGDRLAGQLVRDGDDVVFRYRADYLDDPAAPALAWSLPKSAEPVRASAGSVPPFFAGLLPEGVRLRAVATGARTSEDDHLTLLLAVGADAIGDVRVVPADRAPEDPGVLVDESKVDTLDLEDVFGQAVSTDPAALQRVALPGVQVKVSAAMLSTPVTTTVGPAILKLNPPTDYPRLVHNEHFFLGVAQACRIPIPPCRLVHDGKGHDALLVGRFDRVVRRDGVQRLPQEDACQVLGVYPARKYRLRTEDVARALADTVAAGGGSRPLALRRVMELVVFSYLIGNGDLHGKNLSIRQVPQGRWEITPGYDLLSTQPYTGWGNPMALDLFGRANRLDRAHLLDAARRLGLPERAMARTLDRLTDGVESCLPRLGDIGLGDRATELLDRLVRRRLAEVRG